MSLEIIPTLLQVLISIICLGVVPWAISVQVKLAKIEVHLSRIAILSDDYKKLEERVRILEISQPSQSK